MATKRASKAITPPNAQPPAGEAPQSGGGEFTGRYIVLLKEKANQKNLYDTLGVKMASSTDFTASAIRMEELSGSDGIFYDEIGACVMDLAPDQNNMLQAMAADDSSAILASEPERIMYSLASPDYWKGYKDGVSATIERILADAGSGGAEQTDALLAAALDESRATWGLQVTKVINSRFTGRGVKVAVLDTGLDLTHPDFVGRSIVTQSFIPNQSVQDGAGHGTHCIGTSCGSATPPVLPRYGIAAGAPIFAGKVLSNQGSGGDSGILAGINWAVANGCSVVSMSLGAPTQPGEQPSRVYEGVAQRALAANTLIVAAAGNESRRPGLIAPVGRPANCPSILAVAAVDVNLAIAPFSCGGLSPNNGGGVDIAGPGVAVRSTWPMPRRYNTISGTSMATPHVAGIAALWLEAQRLTASQLWLKLVQTSRRLNLPSRDVGAGLVQAP